MHEFVKNSFFSRRSARFNISALGTPLFSDFQQRTSVFPKQRFLPEISTFRHFRTGGTLFNSFQQSARVCPKSKTALLARDQHVLTFSHWADHFLAIFSEGHQFVQNSVFKTEISTFPHFRTGCNTFKRFLVHEYTSTRVLYTSLYKTAFSAQDQHVLSFSHFVQHFLAFFSKVHEFVQNSALITRSACFVIFALRPPLFSDFQQSARGCTKQRFQPKISTFCHFRTARTTF